MTMKIRQDSEGTLGEIDVGHRLPSNSTTSAFIRLFDDCVVFELRIHEIRGETLSLLLPPNFLDTTGITTNSDVHVQVDFQLAFDRTHYINLHEAVDCLSSDTVSQRLIAKPPHSNACNIDLCLTFPIQADLNSEQQKAIERVLCQRETFPVIVNGPFGTGKTHLLAEAVRIILDRPTVCRILICTQSNHAADLYVKKIDDFFQKKMCATAHLHRIYYKYYNRYRIDRSIFKVVSGYCKFENDQFIMPDKATLEKDRLVVITTLVTSMQLRRLGLPTRFFTHIFIDEAAQATEPETVAALSFASEKTCVVMAGDHKQVCLYSITDCICSFLTTVIF